MLRGLGPVLAGPPGLTALELIFSVSQRLFRLFQNKCSAQKGTVSLSFFTLPWGQKSSCLPFVALCSLSGFRPLPPSPSKNPVLRALVRGETVTCNNDYNRPPLKKLLEVTLKSFLNSSSIQSKGARRVSLALGRRVTNLTAGMPAFPAPDASQHPPRPTDFS